ncbi:hypothetical protein WT24_20345 [Burkholderia sp. MSMB1078WGS]|uniref:hypothetical protein n=1 Tax=Burkholderia sp. MSMB1078WGS TaxID=1637900 RepID=UPI00075B1C49|nr:hypothetical protein [Burkholderia sp. MSMB1078WGS]KVT06758.1 hypothetical protein WT24_20345 [Burkholderia sp. MSMB1078WGS]
MSQLVQIAPGVVFSSDVLSAEWTRKHYRDDGNAARRANALSEIPGRVPAEESGHADRVSALGQLSLL